MPGKPIELPEARDLYRHGLKIVANHRYGKGGTADRLAGVGVDVNHLPKPRFGQWDQPMITDQ